MDRSERETASHFPPFKRVAVLGSGVMGSQIAAHLANSGVDVLLLDIAAKEGRKNSIVEAAFKKMQRQKPPPLATKKTACRIEIGNFDDNFNRLAESEWIIESVIENLEIKKSLFKRIEEIARDDAVVSTNTSGLPITRLAEECPDSFRKRFLGVHFFNPPRYLKLLEVIPTEETGDEVLARVSSFARLHLGKEIVIAKDTPSFIANRIGLYSLNQAVRILTERDYTIEEIDALTGPLVGRSKSATFRTLDIIGLDVFLDILKNLYDATPDCEDREVARAADLIEAMTQKGILGAKAGGGFYKKAGKEILSLNLDTFEYEPPRALNLAGIDKYRKIKDLGDRLRVLYEDRGRCGAFLKSSMLDYLGYAVRQIPETTDYPHSIDRALTLGFALEIGPFQTWDMIGFERVLADMRAEGIVVPEWVDGMEKEGNKSFYRSDREQIEVYSPGSPGKGYVKIDKQADEISLRVIKDSPERVIWEKQDGALLDIGDGVALFEFRSKANSLTAQLLEALLEAIDTVENGDFRGLIIGNEGKNFSMGTNLAEFAAPAREKRFDELESMIARFQKTVRRIRYSKKPVVSAIQGMTLGEACELSMASTQVVAALESYLGLVELSVGLVPAGGGIAYLADWACTRAAAEDPQDIQPFLARAFEAVALSKISSSAPEAQEFGLLDSSARIVMNENRRIHVAREEVLRLYNEGYLPPPKRSHIMVLGTPARAAFEVMIFRMRQSGHATEYDQFLAGKLAYVMTGGDISSPAFVSEEYLLDLERETILSLFGEEKTLARMNSMLKSNRRLRN